MMMFCFDNIQIEDRFRYATWKRNQEEQIDVLGIYFSFGVACSILYFGGCMILSFLLSQEVWDLWFPWIVAIYGGILFLFLRKIGNSLWSLHREKTEKEFVHFLRINKIQKIRFYQKFGQIYCEITKNGKPERRTISIKHSILLMRDKGPFDSMKLDLENLQREDVTLLIEN